MSEIPQGVIPGGWPFVIAAYVITIGVLSGYAFSLFSRFKKAQREEEES